MNTIIPKLEQAFKKCSDCGLHYDYQVLLRSLYSAPLTEELVAYLCEKATSKKHICEIRYEHLKILLLNDTARQFDLKQFYFDCQKRCRRVWLRYFYIRGYAMYATEEEMIPVMQKFSEVLRKCHDYIDYAYLMSVAGLPYLVETYGYGCMKDTLAVAEVEYQKINPLLRGSFTINEQLEQVDSVCVEEIFARQKTVLNQLHTEDSE